MLFTLTNLSTGEAVEWPAHEGELIDYIGHCFALASHYRRDLPTRKTIYRLQWAIRHYQVSEPLQDQLVVFVQQD